MKAVLISIQPKWCAKIASGEKTVEIRKTAPKIEAPFKCYIYCTLPPQEEFFTHGGIREYANELIRLQSGEIVYDYGMRLCCDTEGRPYTSENFLCRKVIGEFVCDRITPLFNIATDDWKYLKGDTHEWHKRLVGKACLTEDELKAYAKGKKCLAWHITDLKIYDKPKYLCEFLKCGAPSEKDLDEELCSYCEQTEWGERRCYGTPTGPVMCEGSFCGEAYDLYLDENYALKRPPQSWCYVEEPNGQSDDQK